MKISLATIAAGAIVCVLLPANHAAAEEQGLRNFERDLERKNKACAIAKSGSTTSCESDLGDICCFCVVGPKPNGEEGKKCMPTEICESFLGLSCETEGIPIEVIDFEDSYEIVSF